MIRVPRIARKALRAVAASAPVPIAWLVWITASQWWTAHLIEIGGAAPGYAFQYASWPSVALAAPVGVMAVSIWLYRNGIGDRGMACAGVLGVVGAVALTGWPEWQRLEPYIGSYPAAVLLSYVSPGIAAAVGVGVLAGLLGGIFATASRTLPGHVATAARARSDLHGHADWMTIDKARTLFPGPDPHHGGIVVGEAYRVDLDRVATLPFEPANRETWGRGGRSPLLIDPCRNGPTHGLVLAGSGGFKTTGIAIPTLLTWTGSAVVLDPSREIGPAVTDFRRTHLGHRVVTLDPADTDSGFNALDWIDVASPMAATNVEAVVAWICGEERTSGAGEFFRDSAKSLIACILADILWDKALTAEERTLKHLRQVLVTPEADLRTILQNIHAGSASGLARDLAGTLMGLVDETFSGIYGNAARSTRWLSNPAYASLVSGSAFRTTDLCCGKLTVFVQIPLKALEATPALARVIIGALLNAAYEADGKVQGRILFLLDEVARLGPMAALESARDAGRKYGITLLLLYQSLGQIIGQWGPEGRRAWYDSTSWRLYATVQDLETAREVSALCGGHGVVAISQGDSTRPAGPGAGVKGQSETRSEAHQQLIRPDELLQDTRADEAFLFIRGQRPLRCGRAIWFRRKEWTRLVGRNRFHATARSG